MGKTYILTPADAVTQHTNAEATVVLGSTVVKGLDVNGVFQSAVLDQSTVGDGAVFAGKTHGESEVDLGIGVEVDGAKLNNVSHACHRG